jgi:hypothetical protein
VELRNRSGRLDGSFQRLVLMRASKPATDGKNLSVVHLIGTLLRIANEAKIRR